MIPRLLALVAAVAMVVGAVTLRSRLDEDGARVAATGSLRLVCSAEVAEACTRLAEIDPRVSVMVEEAAATADRLGGDGPGDADPDGWLVAGPWASFVAEPRRQAGRPPLTEGPVLARSAVGLVVWPERAEVLAALCPNTEVNWKCVGDVAGMRWAELGGPETWGPVKPGHPPSTTAVGLAVVGAATAGFFGRTDLARADLDDDGYRDWLARLERSIPNRSASPLEDMLVRGPSAFDIVGTIEAQARPLLGRSARADKPIWLYPSPMATADVSLASTAGDRGELLARIVNGEAGRKALRSIGWRAEDATPDRPPLPATNGLPDPGVLDALRGVVEEAAR